MLKVVFFISSIVALCGSIHGADKVSKIIRPVEDKILSQRCDVSVVSYIDNSEQPKSKEENVENVKEKVKNSKIPENNDTTQENVVDFDIDKKHAAEFSGNCNALQVFPSDNTNIIMKRHLDDSYKSNEYSEMIKCPLYLGTEGVKRSKLMTEVEDPDTYCDIGRQNLSRISDYNECQTQYMKHNIKFYWYYPTKTRKPIFPTKIKHLKDGSVRRYLGRELKCHIKTLIATQGRKTIPDTKDVATNTSINTITDQQQSKNSNLQKENQNITAKVPVTQKVSKPKKESVETQKTMPSTSQNTRANENQHLKSILNLDTVPFGIPIAFQNLYNKIIMQKNKATTVPKLESRKNTDGSYDFWWSYPHDMSDRVHDPHRQNNLLSRSIPSNSGLGSQNPSKSVVSAPKNDLRSGNSSKSRPPIETHLPKKQQHTKDGPVEINKPPETIISKSNIKNERRPENKERQPIKIISQYVLQGRNPNVEQPQQNVNSDLNLQRPIYDDRNVVIGSRKVNTKPNPEIINPPAINIGRQAINAPQPIDIEMEQLNIQHHQVNIEQQPMTDRQQLDTESSSSDSSDSPEPTDTMQQFHAHRRPIYGFPPYVLPSHGLQQQVLPPYILQPQALPPYVLQPQGLPPYVLPPQSVPPYVLPPQGLPPYVLQPQSLPPCVLQPPYFYPQHVLPPQIWPMAIRPEPNADQEPVTADQNQQQVIDRQQPNEVQQRAHNVPQNLGQRPIVEQQSANIAMQNNIVRRQLNEYQEAINIAPKNVAECRHQRMVERRQLNVEPQPVKFASQQVVERLPLKLPQQLANIVSQRMVETLPQNLAQQTSNIALQQMVERMPLNLAHQPSHIASQQMAEILPLNLAHKPSNIASQRMVERLPLNLAQQSSKIASERMAEILPLNLARKPSNIASQRMVERLPLNLSQQPSNIASQQMAERLAVYVEPRTVNMNPQPMVARQDQNVERQAITATNNRPLAQPQQQQNNDRELERIPFDDPGFMNSLRQTTANRPLAQPQQQQNNDRELERIPFDDPGFMNYLRQTTANRPLAQPQQQQNNDRELERIPFDDPGFMNYLRQTTANRPLAQPQQQQNNDRELERIPFDDLGFMNYLRQTTANRPLAQPQQQQNNNRQLERIPFDDPGFMNYLRQIRESYENFQELLLEGVRPHSPRNPENDPQRQLESPTSQSVPSPVSSPPLDANIEASGRPPVLAHIRLQPLGSPPNMPSMHWDSPDWFEIVRAWLPSPDSAV